MEDKKNETGSTGDHHCGASLSGMSRNNEPRELWCIVENVTAAMANNHIVQKDDQHANGHSVMPEVLGLEQ